MFFNAKGILDKINDVLTLFRGDSSNYVTILEGKSISGNSELESDIVFLEKDSDGYFHVKMRGADGRFNVKIELFTEFTQVAETVELNLEEAGGNGKSEDSDYSFSVDSQGYNRAKFTFENQSSNPRDLYYVRFDVSFKQKNEPQTKVITDLLNEVSHKNIIIGYAEETAESGVIAQMGWLQYWQFFKNSRANSVASDSNGNTYVGYLDGSLTKINSLGKVLWDKNIHSASINDITIDDLGYIYTASDDNTAKKLSPDGDTEWTFSGHDDDVNGIVVEGWNYTNSGPTITRNVYTCGGDNTVRKLNSEGVEQWRFEGHDGNVNAVAVDKNIGTDNPICVYSTSHDDTVKKINENKTGADVVDGELVDALEWSYEISGNGRSVKVDKNRNVCAADEGGQIIKLSPSGNLIWSFSLPVGWAVNIDEYGYVYASSRSFGHSNFNPQNAGLYKLSPEGSEVWKLIISRDGINQIDIDFRNQISIACGREGVTRKINSELQIKGYRVEADS